MGLERRTVLAGLAAGFAGCTGRFADRSGEEKTEKIGEDALYHVSTIDALYCGHFADETTIGEVLENGDWGLGTVNGVDGEMVVADGVAYAVRGDGTADEIDDETKTPFAAVTEFESDKTVELDDVEGFEGFTTRINEELPRTDHFHALKVEGEFDYLRTRSVEEQVEPYPTLEEVVENEVTFEFENVEGSMPTFYIPDRFEGIHPPGYHSHFVTGERDGGGHVYDFRADSLTVEIDQLKSIHVELAEREVEEYPPCG